MIDISMPEVDFALNTVRDAALLARRIQAGMAIMNLTKSDLSPVTVADFALQAIVSRLLEESFPNDTLVAEESSDHLRPNQQVLDTVVMFVQKMLPDATADDICRWIDRGQAKPGTRWWTLDPIDGTKGYMRGGQYAVALALVDAGEVKIGAIGCPNLGAECVPETSAMGGVLAVATRGRGSWQKPLIDEGEFTPLRASACSEPKEARLFRSHEASHTNVEQIEALVKHLGSEAEPVLMDSMAKYAVLAAGHGEILVRLLSPKDPDYREKVWDQAAGSLLIEEAGGRVTDLEGRPLDFTHGRRLEKNRGLVATNGLLHDAVLEALAAVGATG